MKIIGIGDSIMAFYDSSEYPQTGWIQMLDRYMIDPKKVIIHDYALKGRSTKSFIDEGQYKLALDDVKKGDYVFISFGHNDEKEFDPSRYCPAYGSYQENLAMFYKDIVAKGATPVFFSSVERMLYDQNGVLTHSHGDYIKAMEDVCTKIGAIYIDLNKLTYDFYNKHTFEGNRKYIMTLLPGEYANFPDGNKDTTHLTVTGAMNICRLLVPELKKVEGLGKLFK